MPDIQDIIQTTRELVAFRSMHDNPEGLKKCAEYIADFFDGTNLSVDMLESNGVPSVVVTKNNKTPKVFLAGHFDVVGAPDEDFDVEEKKGKLFGRGVFDMKGGAAVFMHVLKELADTDHDVGLMLVGDEEIGGPDGTEYVLKQGYLSDVVLMPDGGMNVHTMVAKEKGLFRIFIKAHGKTAHGSRPWEGRDANMMIARAMCTVQDMFLPLSEHPEDHWVTTCNFGYMEGGHILNQVSDHAEAHMDVRIAETDDPDELYKKVCAALGEHITVELHALFPPVVVPTDSSYVQTYRDVLKEKTGKELEFLSTHGSSDTRFFDQKGSLVIMTQPDGGNHHSPGEWVSVQGLEDYYHIVRGFVERVSKEG